MSHPLSHLYLPLCLILAIYCQLEAAPATAPAEPAQTLPQIKDAARQRVLIQWHDMPDGGQHRATDVGFIKTENDQLLFGTHLELSPNSTRITIQDYPGHCFYRYRSALNGGPGFFVLERYDFSDPAVIDVHEMILSSPGLLQLVQDIEMPDKTQTVTLSQASGDEKGVTLRVQTVRETDGSELLKLTLEAPTLAQLRRDHAAEVDRYVRPLFRSLFQDSSLFGVNEKLAWQVVRDAWQAPPGIEAQVKQTIAEFNADGYTQREAAQKKLAALGQPAALYLMSMDRSNLSGEQAARVDQFLHPYRLADEQQCRTLGTDVSFLLDCLNTDDADLRGAVLKHLQKTTHREIALSPDLSPADRAQAIAKLRETLLPGPSTKAQN